MIATIFPKILDQNKAKLTDYIHYTPYFINFYLTGTYTFDVNHYCHIHLHLNFINNLS